LTLATAEKHLHRVSHLGNVAVCSRIIVSLSLSLATRRSAAMRTLLEHFDVDGKMVRRAHDVDVAAALI
jgi:hypothetical protein